MFIFDNNKKDRFPFRDTLWSALLTNLYLLFHSIASDIIFYIININFLMNYLIFVLLNVQIRWLQKKKETVEKLQDIRLLFSISSLD